MEKDEAGRLRAFRSRFGRGWDTETATDANAEAEKVEDSAAAAPVEKAKKRGFADGDEAEGSLMDLISGGAYTSTSGQKPKKAPKKGPGSGGDGGKA